jgi:hypothetical protein
LRLVGILVLLACAATAAAADPWPQAGVLRHPDHAAAPLDRTFLRAVFTMRLREWPDGTPIRVFVLGDDSPLHDRFSREQLGTYPYVLRSIWDRLVFTGTGTAPTVLATEEEMWQRVRSTPGAIGYVRLTEGRGEPVQVVPVPQGKDP